MGLARSIRQAFPEAELVAVDYSPRSSGLHHPVFDDVLLFRSFDELDLDSHADRIAQRLGPGSLWISGLDLEVGWLAENVQDEPSVLAPGPRAFDAIRKPDIRAARRLPVNVPPSRPAFGYDPSVENFCQRHDWRVWVKGPNYDAILARSWDELVDARRELAETWSTSNVFVQTHVEGREVAIPFAAHDGELLDAALMRKSVRTDAGKTWAGRLRDVPEEIRAPLADVLDELGWTGGGELEFVEDPSGGLHLVDLNPRFPAWIHGATIAGYNLPARLLEAATGETARECGPSSSAFARIVLEQSVRSSHPLPRSSRSDREPSVGGKHPSGMPLLAARSSDQPTPEEEPAPVEEPALTDLADLDAGLDTPARVEMERTASEAFQRALAVIEGDPPVPEVEIAYSVKTNPDRRLLARALEHGFLAEVISGKELGWARKVGFEPSQVVVNGPAGVRDLLEAETGPVHAVFADSLEALEALVQREPPPARVMGLRVRPPGVRSRFGIPVEDPSAFGSVVDLLEQAPSGVELGLHVHVQSSRIGVDRWREVVDGVSKWARVLGEQAGRPVTTVDVGGGWTPEHFQQVVPETVDELHEAVSEDGIEIREILLEPGKALARGSRALLSRVIETRETPRGGRDLVLDAARSDLPMAGRRPHPVAIGGENGWRRLRAGDDRLLGRICMENDVLADGLQVPESVGSGDLVAFLQAGAYDASMSYSFGTGGWGT